MDLYVDPVPSEERGAVGWLPAAGPGGRDMTVGSFVPAGFAAYARILHPARVGDRDATWAEIARWSGKGLRADSDSKDLMVRADGARWEDDSAHQRPGEGTWGLGPAGWDRLCQRVAAATGTPDVVWALFDIISYPFPGEWSVEYSPVSPARRRGPFRGASPRRAARREAQGRRELMERCGVNVAGDRCILHRGRLVADGADLSSAPNDWWPDDRAWIVHTNVDCPTTYVGGSRDLVEALLATDQLEVFEAGLDDPFDGHG